MARAIEEVSEARRSIRWPKLFCNGTAKRSKAAMMWACGSIIISIFNWLEAATDKRHFSPYCLR